MPIKKAPVLAIDIGNTSVAFGLFEGSQLVRHHRSLTHGFKPADLRPFARFRGAVRTSVICSVVPKANRPVETAVKKILGAEVVLLGRDRRVPIPNQTAKPRQVGMDRLVNAWAAWQRFKRPCVVVDFGTATTFDVVNGKGAYVGGLITPGIQLTLNALAEKTALLPRIALKPVRRVVGRDTVSSIRSGCAYGLGALCDGVLNQIDLQTKERHDVLSTGGYARFMSAYASRLNRIDEHLTLRAIASLSSTPHSKV